MTSFNDQVVLITGAGSGIGRELALQLAKEGAAIAAVDLQAEPLAKLTADLAGQRVATAVGDVTDAAGLREAVRSLVEQLGPIDILIANAGIGLRTPAREFKAAEFEAQVRVNLIGVANSIETVLASMLERRRGHIVAISSLASFRGLPSMAGYCASKAGVNALMDALRVELLDSGVALTTVCPGFIRTPLTAPLSGKIPMLDLAEAIRVIVETIRQKRTFHAFPRTPAFRARLLRWLPLGWADRLAAKYHRRYLPID
jgi:NAD(P)-dependent dehydrogenase (short-subunit alcohol dehydrogenase family)